jgi:hypothetical protein
MTVEVSECTEPKEWDSLVGRSLSPTAFHAWAWLKTVEKHSGFKMHPLVAKLGTNPFGVFPVFSKEVGCVRVITSPPQNMGLPYLGPLIIPHDVVLKRQTLEKSALSFADSFDAHIKEKLKPNYTAIITGPQYDDARPLTWNKYAVWPGYVYVKGLSAGEEATLKNFDHDIQAKIKKAIEVGVVVREGGKKELERIKGENIGITRQYILEVYESVAPKHVRVLSAYHQGENIGVLVCAIHQAYSSQIYFENIRHIEDIDIRTMLQWEAIRRSNEGGRKFYELGGANDPQSRMANIGFNPEVSIRFHASKYAPQHIKYFIQNQLKRGQYQI